MKANDRDVRISEKVREEAARLCSACACHSNPISVTDMTSALYGVPRTVAVRKLVARVAVRAWSAAHIKLRNDPSEIDDETTREDYAEAEALLRTGWTVPRQAKGEE